MLGKTELLELPLMPERMPGIDVIQATGFVVALTKDGQYLGLHRTPLLPSRSEAGKSIVPQDTTP